MGDRLCVIGSESVLRERASFQERSIDERDDRPTSRLQHPVYFAKGVSRVFPEVDGVDGEKPIEFFVAEREHRSVIEFETDAG